MISVLFEMTIPKIGDFLLLTPSLREAQNRYPDAAVAVPAPLRPLYRREKILANIVEGGEGIEAERIIDLTFPHLDFKPRASAQRFDGKLFEAPEHITSLYHRALRGLLPRLPEKVQAQPFLEIDADEDRLKVFGLAPFSYYTVHTGSDYAPKNWGDENFEALIEQMAQTHPDLRAVGLFGPQDEELFKNRPAPPTYKSLRADFEAVADILAGSLFHVDNDSGINHLAGVINTPSLSVWGFTGPGTWGALGERQFTFWGGPSCEHHCGGAEATTCAHRICLTSISPRDLMPAVEEILNSYRWNVR